MLANLRITWEKIQTRKRNTWYGNLFCVVFFIYAGIGDNTQWEDACSNQTLKRYQNVKTSMAASKAQSQYLKHNHKLHMLNRRKRLRNSIKLNYKESATAGVL